METRPPIKSYLIPEEELISFFYHSCSGFWDVFMVIFPTNPRNRNADSPDSGIPSSSPNVLRRTQSSASELSASLLQLQAPGLRLLASPPLPVLNGGRYMTPK